MMTVSTCAAPASAPHDAPQPTTTATATSTRPTTILEDAAGFNIKHPLQYTWNLWLKDGSVGQRPGRSAPVVTSGNWKDQLQDIDAISTVEDFWGYRVIIFLVYTY